MTKILIADGMDKAALELLKSIPGFEVTVNKGMSEAELIQAVPGTSAVVVRSASRITRPVIEAGKDLKVLVRAGIGLDNIDRDAAKEKGIFVANTPAATSITVADLGCGDHRVTLTERRFKPPASAAATLTVTCPGVDLGVDPAVIAEGMTTHVTGSGFVPDQPVTLAWQLSDGSTVPADGSPATADGNGRVSFYCLVLAHQDVGGRTLIATQSVDTFDGTLAQLTAQTTAVVQGGTMQPSGPMLNRLGPQLVLRR